MPEADAAPPPLPPPPPGDRIVEVLDERTPLATAALEVIVESFPPQDRQSLHQLRTEIGEKRLGLLSDYDFFLFTAINAEGEAMGSVAGIYLDGINAGFVTYLAVRSRFRGRRLARRLRTALLEACRAAARGLGYGDLAWVVGEVQADNPWLRRLTETRGAIIFDLDYYHPGMLPGAAATRYILYRQPIADARPELPAELVRRILYSIYRRAYRVRYPLDHEAFRFMLQQVEGREIVGPHPGF